MLRQNGGFNIGHELYFNIPLCCLKYVMLLLHVQAWSVCCSIGIWILRVLTQPV